MSILYILVPLALVFSATAVGVFVWAIRKGQFQDLQTPAMRILFEDDAKVGQTTLNGSSEKVEKTEP